MKMCLKQTVAVGLALMMSNAVFALPSDRQQPINLVADKLTFNEKTGVNTYSGNVIITQGTMRLQANSIVANFNAKKEIQTITAKGSPAYFQQKTDPAKGLAKGSAQQIVYNADTGIITLTGNASLEQDGSSIKGGVLRYSMNKGDIEALGTPNKTGSSSGRVQMVIPPSASKSFPGARD
ncbi:lipopolysaccharide transport periplasmic protein LptA [Acinetobacter sp. SAAs470]|uniref:lipopolysaccharide transport periplasmic protein LptA n=1 Tax=unclassified Acinetobacter TaxID=196816 RepID=UPI003977B782